MIIKDVIDFPIPSGSEERRTYVYLPDSYDEEEDKYYPVLYMFDGHNVFFDEDATYGKSWGMKDYMDYSGTEIIIAAVECNHDSNNGRLKEYSPYTFRDPNLGLITGRGRSTMQWMIHTFKKEVDKSFRTLPDRENTFIAGSSMGGLMSLYAVLEFNSVFSRAAALSPSLWVAPDKIRSMIKRVKLDPNTVLYMDYGSREMENHNKIRQQFTKIAAQLLEKQVMLNCRIVPGGEHCEACWEEQIPFFMNTLLYR
ncbi:MAG: alpha/beta hydrolase [Enterocloster sp.]